MRGEGGFEFGRMGWKMLWGIRGGLGELWECYGEVREVLVRGGGVS